MLFQSARYKVVVSKKATKEEKGKRKMVDTSESKPSPPRTRRRTGGIFIQEPSETPVRQTTPEEPIDLEEEHVPQESEPQTPFDSEPQQSPTKSSPIPASLKPKHGKSIPSKTKPSPIIQKSTTKSSIPGRFTPRKRVPTPQQKKSTTLPQKKASSDPSLKNFRLKKDKSEFYSKFGRKNYTRGKFLNFKFFEDEGFLFVNWLRKFGIFEFLSEKLMIYDELVKLFYFYLTEEEGEDGIYVYTTYLRGKEIRFTAEEFASIMKLPYVTADKTYDRKEVVECLTGKESLSNRKGGFTNKFFTSVEFKLIHHIVTHCLFPRNGGHDAVSIYECVLIYCIVYNLEYDLVDAMLLYMFNQKDRANGHLPYAMYLTRLFQHFEIDLSDDVPTCPSSYNEINIGTLRRMRYIKYDDGKWRCISAAPGEESEDIPVRTEATHEDDEGDEDVLGEERVLDDEEGSQGLRGKDPQAEGDSATVSDDQPTPTPAKSIPRPLRPNPFATSTASPNVTIPSSSPVLDVSTLQALLAASLGSLKTDLQAYIREQIQASSSADQSDSTKK